MSDPILVARNVRKTFGDVVANDDVDFEVEPGEIHSILGENGAGKTTFMNVVYGTYDLDGGEIRYDGEPVSFDSPQDALDHGIGLVYQEFKLIEPFSVLDNILIGVPDDRWYEANESTHREAVASLSEEYGLGLADRLDWRVSELSEGEKQRTEILKALYRDLDVLLLDEPTSILTPQEVEDLFAVLDRLVREENLAVVFITHKLDEVMAVSDRVTVLRKGRSVGTTAVADTTREELAGLIVGDDDTTLVDRLERAESERTPLLDVDGVTIRNDRGQVAADLSMQVDRNEIVGLVGVEGNGQEELVEAIAGLRPVLDGTIALDGDDVSSLTRKQVQDRGIVYLPAAHGVIDEFSVENNAILDSYDSFYDSGLRDDQRITTHAEQIVEDFDVVTPGVTVTAGQLSGGNKQKLLLGRKLLLDDRSLFVAVNPTKGLDIGTKQFIHRRLVDERESGRGVLLVTADIDEALVLADRLLVVNDGSIVAEFESVESVSREEIGLAMTGQAGVSEPPGRANQ